MIKSKSKADTVGSCRRAKSGGFTLVEVMIALVVAGLLAAAVIDLLMGQNDFYAEHDEVVFAEQSLRATADLVASEMRLGGSRDVISAQETSFTYRFDVMRAVVCKESSGSVSLFVFEEVDNANLGSDRGSAFSNPFSTTFQYDDDFDSTGDDVLGSTIAKTDCDAAGAPGSLDTSRYRLVDWSLASIGPPEKGAIVRVYGTLEYRFASSSFWSGVALWRNGQELVGPFGDGAGLEYYVCTSSCTWKSPVPSSEAHEVEKIRLVADAIGEGENRYDVRRELNHKITLRN